MKRLVAVVTLLVAFGIGAAPANAKKGDLIVGEYDELQVSRVDPASGATDPIHTGVPFGSPSYLAFGRAGLIFLTDGNGLFEVDPATGAVRDLTDDEVSFYWGIDSAASGDLLVSDAGDTIFEIDATSGEASIFAQGGSLTDGWGLDALPNRTTLVAEIGNESVLRLAADGEQSIVSSDSQLGEVSDVARAPNGDVFITSQSEDGLLLKIARSGGVDELASGLGVVYSLAVAPDGLIYTTDYTGDAVNRVDPRTGSVSEVASAADGVGGPIGIEIEPPKCKGKLATIVGSQKKDKLKGSKFKDVIVGLKGNDKIKGGKGKDRICGGKGKDKLNGNQGRDKIIGGPGKDKEKQ